MTGLNLETFLRLLRADSGAWAGLGAILLILALMTWTSWGSRRALRKCLVLSIAAHLGLVFYGGSSPIILRALRPADATRPAPERRITVRAVAEPAEAARDAPVGRGGRGPAAWDRPGEIVGLAGATARPMRPEPEASAEGPTRIPLAAEAATPEVAAPAPVRPEARPEGADPAATTPPEVMPGDPAEIAPAVVARATPDPAAGALPPGAARPRPEPPRPSPSPFIPERPAPPGLAEAPTPAPAASSTPQPRPVATPSDSGTASTVAAAGAEEIAPAQVQRPSTVVPSGMSIPNRSRPAGLGPKAGAAGREALPSTRPPIAAVTATSPASPPSGRPSPVVAGSTPDPIVPAPSPTDAAPFAPVTTATRSAPDPRSALPDADTRRLARPDRVGAAPDAGHRPAEGIALARVVPSGSTSSVNSRRPTGVRSLSDVPPVYRSRLDPNRTAAAQRAGASAASEQAVERALDWLKRHQDADGRWDGGTARDLDNNVAQGEDDYTSHCPPGEVCAGECRYFDVDTALSGLALLAYLGAGYTHTDGKYADTVGGGINFLLRSQKPDGDLRGPSRAVGMYCHAMAALALCEAYALTGDERLRGPVERAVGFIARSQAADGLSWRYKPREAIGDTSILGWVILFLKSAKVVGVPVPPAARSGAVGWLGEVAAGRDGGLARYQPTGTDSAITPTMTAEAWVCRQFLELGGPGRSSSEAAGYLLQHTPDREPYNVYYIYYGTLAMYQHGGDSWSRWNGRARDLIVDRQRRSGHQAGSYDPDETKYGLLGGRIYATALSTLSLEVYYRFLRLYDEPRPAGPPVVAPAATPARPADGAVRRLGGVPGPR